MARLNEAPAATLESNFEILRRKFLRQNRDLAKVNSNQSNRIRTLENECARLLSENLDLRGQVMRLEKELEINKTGRIADHALEIKAKMEAQLAELVAMVSSLGSEPPSKRHSPERGKHPKPAPRGLRSPAQRKFKNPTGDQEALAAQEGRLPPIHENKAYPRATLNSEEIMALCAEAADSSNSPGLGPPPVSRYVDEDALRASPPAKKTEKTEKHKHSDAKQHKQTEDPTPLPKSNLQRKTPSNLEPSRDQDPVPCKATKSASQSEQPKAGSQAQSTAEIRAGAKRKYGDENETPRAIRLSTGKENDGVEKTAGRDRLKARNIKELPAGKRGIGRPALSAKSTNDDVSSPKKPSREEASKPSKLLPQQPKGMAAPVPKLEIPAVQDPNPPVVDFLPDLVSPNTPERPGTREGACDTPPPGHLSVDGETSRPNRRARAAISYAEPNLRDKMRRPTKELFDAVSGEGKFKARQSMTASLVKGDEWAPTFINRSGSDGARTAPGLGTERAIAASAKDATRRESAVSPLVQRELQSMDMLPSSVVTERRKRASAVGVLRDPTVSAEEKLSDKENSAPLSTIETVAPAPVPASPARLRNRPEKTLEIDIYDFASSSPARSQTKDPPEGESANKPKRQARRASAAAHQALREYAAATGLAGDEPTTKSRGPGHGRKRASMMGPRRIALAELVDGEDDSRDGTGNGGEEGESPALGDKISGRRRSMML